MAGPQGWTPETVTPAATTPGWTPEVSALRAEPDFRSSNAPGLADAVGATWDWANKPLIPQIADAAQAVAAYLDQPKEERSSLVKRTLFAMAGLTGLAQAEHPEAELRGFAAGATEGAGHVVASLTSPLGVVLALVGAGPEGALAKRLPALKGILELPAVARLQRAVQVGAGAGFAAQGAREVATAPTVGGKLAGVAQMAGGAAGVLGGLRGPRAGSAAAPAGRPQLSGADQASNDFAAARGIPLDAATATGSRWARAMQKRALNSIGGEGIGERAIQDTQGAVTRTGGELAADVHPAPVGPEDAGKAVHGALKNLIGTFDRQATTEYDALRAIEADPTHAERVHTAPPGSRAFRTILDKLTTGIRKAAADPDPEIVTWANTVGGRAPTVPELTVMRQIEAELDAQPYTPYLLKPTRYGGGLEHVEGTGGAGAPVYDDILQAAPGTAGMDRGEVQAAIANTLETGEWTNASRGAYKVAQDRLKRSGALRGPSLDPGAPLLGTARDVPLPVNLEVPKQMLEPLYRRLKRESELVPLQGGKARALVALDRLMTGPEVESVSIVDQALGDLKEMARTDDMPELRTQGQGIAAAAVKHLGAAVDRAVAKAGPGAVNALEAGRQATVAKYQTATVLESLHEAPVNTYRQLTRPRDGGLPELRQVAEYAPAEVPKIARAKLDEWLELAGERGHFDHADRLYTEWQKLGPETKRILFSSPGQVQELDRFFLLAKRLHENPNPSGTAAVNNAFNWGSIVLANPVARILYMPGGVRFLTRLMQLRLSALPSTGLAPAQLQRTAGFVAVANAAKAAGFPVALPRAADAAPAEGKR